MFLPGDSPGQRSLESYSGVTESWTGPSEPGILIVHVMLVQGLELPWRPEVLPSSDRPRGEAAGGLLCSVGVIFGGSFLA